MGYFKELMIEYDERGYGEVPQKSVCAKLFARHKYIREFIQSRGSIGICDYCGEEAIVLPLEKIVEMVATEFFSIFEDPAEEVPFESHGIWDELEGTGLHKEGSGYILPDNRSIMSTSEALQYVRFEPESDELLDDITDCFRNDAWVLHDPLYETDQERLFRNWDEFWNNTIKEFRNDTPYGIIQRRHQHLLDYLADVIASNRHQLVSHMDKDSIIYRCVNYDPVPYPLDASKLWAPPVQFASSQRMSRDGQSRLYASFDKDTPLKEAVSNGPNKKHCLGTFSLTHSIDILDFTNIPYPRMLNVPDYFAYAFFYGFAKAIVQPVGENEKYKYVPTQLMRDIIESKFMHSGIMGIKYNSVKGDSTQNIVLFLDNNTCANFLHHEGTEIL